MGLLTTGTPLTWDETKQHAEHIRRHGLQQLVNLYHRLKDRKNDVLKWGDEIEYMLVHFDEKNRDARLALIASPVLTLLGQQEALHDCPDTHWAVEYGNYMIEGTPGRPFCCTLCRLRYVETSMYLRRLEAKKVLEKFGPVKLMYLATFPRAGCDRFTEPAFDNATHFNAISNSLYFPDEAIFNGHPRFQTLTRNIRCRKNRRVNIQIPVFKDDNTGDFVEPVPPNDDGQAAAAIRPNHIYMDCMGFGMGCCCLQITMQARNIDEARYLYDELVVLAPLLMPLTAASPIFKGYLSDHDCRWNVISGSVDDRTDEELRPVNANANYIKSTDITLTENYTFDVCKSRYSSVDMYISPENEKFNDVPVKVNPKYEKFLVENGFDALLARHFAHLFIRDPVSVFQEKLDLDDSTETDHFENIQSTNWQSVRFKPPPPNNDTIGWRVEFRTLESQLTDFGNAAYVIFIMLITRMITNKRITLILPLSYVEKNMELAVQRNAVRRNRFYHRTNLYDLDQPPVVELMSLDEIINGCERIKYPGLKEVVRIYMEEVKLNMETRWHVNRALDIISKKADGTFMTAAAYIRDFVQNHKDYKKDSVVARSTVYDLCVELDKISNGEKGCAKLFGSYKQQTVPSRFVDHYREMLRCQDHELFEEGEKREGSMGSTGEGYGQ